MASSVPGVSGDLHTTAYFVLLFLFFAISSAILGFSIVLPRTPATTAAAKAAVLTMAVSSAGIILPPEELSVAYVAAIFLVLVHGTAVLVTSVMVPATPLTMAVARTALLVVELSVGNLVLTVDHRSGAHLMEPFVVLLLSQTFPVMTRILRRWGVEATES